MRYTISGLLGASLCANLYAWPALFAFPATPPADDRARIVQEIQNSIAKDDSPHDTTSRMFAMLFKRVGPEGIRELKGHRDDSIALQAAWQEVAVTVPEKEPRPTVMRPDHDKLVCFLGFLEGRARIRAPQWWADSLLDSRANRWDNIYPGAKTDSLYDSYHNSGLDQVRAPRNTILKRNGDEIVLHVGTDVCPIPEDILGQKAGTENGEEFFCNLSALMTAQRCFVAVHGFAGNPHELVCIERPSGKLLWKTRVWGNFWGDLEGQASMWVALIEHDNRILVFGSSLGMNVEAFRVTDGENLFRFATTY